MEVAVLYHLCEYDCETWIQLFKTCICFRTEQLVARILSNKYIWLLLEYKTDELGTHSDSRQKNI